MIQKIFAVHDQKAEAYLPIFQLPTTAMAQRTFADCVNSSDHQFGKNPEDYTLREIAELDTDSAEITPLEIAKTICNGIECVQSSDG